MKFRYKEGKPVKKIKTVVIKKQLHGFSGGTKVVINHMSPPVSVITVTNTVTRLRS